MRERALVEVRFSRLWSIFMIVGLLVVGGISLAFTIASWPERPILLVFSAVFTALFAWGIAVTARKLVHPPLLFRVDEHGVTCCFREDRYEEPGLFVAWDRVESMGLVHRSTVSGDGGHGRLVTLALTLIEGDDVPEEYSVGGTTDTRVLHLDATAGTLRGERLLEAVRRVAPVHLSSD